MPNYATIGKTLPGGITMASNRRYKDFERLMTVALIACTVIFILYVIVADVGIVWLKILLAIIDFFLCVAGFGFLTISLELTKPRSLWITCGYLAITLCLLVSLILNYPR